MDPFTKNERTLGALVDQAVAKGMPKEVFGMTGMRTVGPSVTMRMDDDDWPVFVVNNDHGILLGKTYAEARATVFRLYEEWKRTASAVG